MSIELLRAQISLQIQAKNTADLLKFYRDEFAKEDDHLRTVINTMIHNLETATADFEKASKTS